MKYKKQIEKLLFELKSVKVDRAKIEEDLHYSPNYVDQVLAKGGNKKFYERLSSYTKAILEKAIHSDFEFLVQEPDLLIAKGHTATKVKVDMDIEKELLREKIEDLKQIISLQKKLLEDKKEGSPPMAPIKSVG